MEAGDEYDCGPGRGGSMSRVGVLRRFSRRETANITIYFYRSIQYIRVVKIISES